MKEAELMVQMEAVENAQRVVKNTEQQIAQIRQDAKLEMKHLQKKLNEVQQQLKEETQKLRDREEVLPSIFFKSSRTLKKCRKIMIRRFRSCRQHLQMNKRYPPNKGVVMDAAQRGIGKAVGRTNKTYQ